APRPGELCIEAAVCLALGEPHGDRPSCVHSVDRAYAIAINDANWPSDAARAKALLPLGLAQLGTAGKDRRAWVEYVVVQTVKRVLPPVLRQAGLNEHAEACAAVTALASAYTAAVHADAAHGVAVHADAAYAADAARAARAARAAYAADAAAAYDAADADAA